MSHWGKGTGGRGRPGEENWGRGGVTGGEWGRRWSQSQQGQKGRIRRALQLSSRGYKATKGCQEASPGCSPGAPRWHSMEARHREPTWPFPAAKTGYT